MTSPPQQPSAATDWVAIRRRMAVAAAALDPDAELSPEAERQVLKTRAHVLALPPPPAVDEGEATLEVIEFELASEHYALPLAQVQEVSLLREVTPVPCAPSFVVGLMNLHGEIRAVIDLKKFFDLPSKGLTELNKIILVQHDDLCLGILADAIRGVRRIPLASLESALATLTGIRSDYLRGVTSDRLIVLDSAKILSDPRLLVHEDVAP